MHNDSGAALEAISFAYAAQSPLPNGHEWLFAVAGCLHPLPVDRDGFVFVAVRGKGVYHGTLPTSSTEPHFANHAGVGSALVNKADIVQLLAKRGEPGQLRWPTPEDLKARREKVAAQKNEGDVANLMRDLAGKQLASETALQEERALQQRLAEVVGAEAQEEGEASSSVQGERAAARQAILSNMSQTTENALDIVLTSKAKTVELTKAMAGLKPLTVNREVEAAAAAAADDEGEEPSNSESEAEAEAEEEPAAAAATESLPENRAQLLAAIADPAREFGLLTTAPSTLATPAIRALKAVCRAKGVNVPPAAATHKRGQPLPKDLFIAKVHSRTRSNSLFHVSTPTPQKL